MQTVTNIQFLVRYTFSDILLQIQLSTVIYGMAAGILLQCIINRWGVLYCNLNTIKVGGEQKSNWDITAYPLEEAINPD